MNIAQIYYLIKALKFATGSESNIINFSQE